MYSHVVIPVDGSEAALRAAECGLGLAGLFGATVEVVHVVERKALRLTSSAEERERLHARGDRALSTVEDLAAERGQSVETVLLEGVPAAELSAFAAERDADLVVVGRQGLTGLGRRLLGGVTEQLLHRSDVPTLVVPAHAPVPRVADCSRLLLPTDGSENAEGATQHGVAVAERTGAAVHVLNVVDLQAAGGLFDAGGLDAAFIDRLEARGREAVERVATAVHESLPTADVETAVARTTEFDGVAAGIRDYVAETDVDLVVMGSHGRSNLGRQFLGSVSSAVLRTVDVPVLVVPRGSPE